MIEEYSLYNYKRRVKKIKEKTIQSKKIKSANTKHIIDFINNKTTNQEISLSREYKLWYIFNHIGEICKKDFMKMTKTDVTNIIEILKEKDYAATTLSDYKKLIKAMWKFLKGKPNSRDYPEEVADMSCNGKPKIKEEKDMITFDECKEMVAKEPNPRNKAIIMLLFETGIRVGELMNMKTSDIKFSSNGFGEITVSGKTGIRNIPNFYLSAPYLKRYIAGHPNEDKRKGWLWICPSNPNKPVSYTIIRRVLNEAGRRANIDKPLNPHNFRHSAVTHWDKIGLTDQEKKMLAGWTTTEQLQTYSHIGKKQVKDKIMQIYGEVMSEQNKPEKQLKCPSCRNVNEVKAKYCVNCGWCFTDEALNERKEFKENTELLIAQNKKMIEEILNRMGEREIALTKNCSKKCAVEN